MLTASGSALVSGASPSTIMEKTQVKVLRAFLLKTVRQEIDSVLELDRRLAVELAAANKVELLKPKETAAAAVAELKTDPKAATPKTSKERGNAGQ